MVPLLEFMVILDPKLYRQNVIHDSKGVPLLYVNMNKTLYGLLKNTLLLYKNLRGELDYITNKNIYSINMKSNWHVDDLKVTHNDTLKSTKFGMLL